VVSSPFRPAKTAFASRAPAKAMESVALPLPFFAETTTVPASCTFLSKSGTFSAAMVAPCLSCEKSGRIADWMHRLHALLAEGDLGREVGQLRDRGHHVGALRGVLAVQARQDRLRQPRPREGHGERGAALAVLRRDDHGPGVLHLLVQVRDLLGGDGRAVLVLREKRQDRGARVAPDHWDRHLLHGAARELVHELVGAQHVKGRDPHDPRRAQALLLPHLAHGWHHGVHRVHDQRDHRLGAELGARLHDVLRDASVDVQQVLPRLPWLPRHTRRHQN